MIHVALVANQAYLYPMLVTAASMVAYTKSDLTFHLFEDGFTAEDRETILNALLRLNSKTIVQWHKIDLKVFDNLSAWKGNRMTYVRVLFPNSLPDIDFVIYSDVDALWLDDIAKLWSLRDSGVIAKFRRDDYDESYLNDAAYLKEKDGINLLRNEYVCGGIALFNLKMLRDESFVDKSLAWLNSHRDVPMVDQTMYNGMLHGRMGLLPEEWGATVRYYRSEMYPDGVVLHYADHFPFAKGFDGTVISDMQVAWILVLSMITGESFETNCEKYLSHVDHWHQRRRIYKYLGNWSVGTLRLACRIIPSLKNRQSIRYLAEHKRNYGHIDLDLITKRFESRGV